MSSAVLSYDAVKSSIRLLLTSASRGLTMAQLDADYQRYNQSAHIPFFDFGYATLLDFLRDIPDVAHIETSTNPPIIHGIKAIGQKKKWKLRQQWGLIQSNDSECNNDGSSRSALIGKPIKRLALHPLPITSSNVNTDRRRHPHFSSSTGYLIRKMSDLSVNLGNMSQIFPNDISADELLTIPMGTNDTCRIVRCANGKLFIACFELARVLHVDEDVLDRETMFSRQRVYSTNNLFNTLLQTNLCCQHSKDPRRPYVFLFLIASIIPLLKMPSNNAYVELLSTFEQLFL